VGPATAKVAVERVADLRFARRRIDVEKRLRLHDHAIDAIAALGGLLVDEGPLQRQAPN